MGGWWIICGGGALFSGFDSAAASMPSDCFAGQIVLDLELSSAPCSMKFCFCTIIDIVIERSSWPGSSISFGSLEDAKHWQRALQLFLKMPKPSVWSQALAFPALPFTDLGFSWFFMRYSN